MERIVYNKMIRKKEEDMHFSLKSLLTAGFLCFVLGSGAEASPKILYVPLDNRPVCLEYTVDTARAAGYL